MAQVVCNRFLLDLIAPSLRPPEESQLDIDAHNVRDLIKLLEKQFPGVSDHLKHGVAIAIDGEIHNSPLLESLQADSEVYFLPAIEGG